MTSQLFCSLTRGRTFRPISLCQGEPSDVDSYAEAIPLLAGSHLSAVLSRQQRDLFSNNAQDLFGVMTPFKSIILTPVLLMQQDPSPPDLGPNTPSLRVHMRDDVGDVSSIVQDYADASVLNGLATFGGFWTFVNGAFAMVFGANILYFSSGDGRFLHSGSCTYFRAAGLFGTGTRIFPPSTPRAGSLDRILQELWHFCASAWWISTMRTELLGI
ncbi:hypothetical protein B0H19DRAFT_1099127 [Mycena capillaripes]|nr:hypothetical protein B0H19DRAFT_1099127 [Mycena capillaripes]